MYVVGSICSMFLQLGRTFVAYTLEEAIEIMKKIMEEDGFEVEPDYFEQHCVYSHDTIMYFIGNLEG